MKDKLIGLLLVIFIFGAFGLLLLMLLVTAVNPIPVEHDDFQDCVEQAIFGYDPCGIRRYRGYYR